MAEAELARQDMEQDAADERVRQRHNLLPIGARAAAILTAHGDAGLSKRISRLFEIANRWV